MRFTTLILTLAVPAALALTAVGCKHSAPTKADKSHESSGHGDGHAGHDHAGHSHEAVAATPTPAAAQATSLPADQVPASFDAAPPVGTVAKCPVSGDVFTVAADHERAEHNGKHVVFCCQGCVDKFKGDPAKFL